MLTEAAFSELTERHRRELQLHCYRMLGSCGATSGECALDVRWDVFRAFGLLMAV